MTGIKVHGDPSNSCGDISETAQVVNLKVAREVKSVGVKSVGVKSVGFILWESGISMLNWIGDTFDMLFSTWRIIHNNKCIFEASKDNLFLLLIGILNTSF